MALVVIPERWRIDVCALLKGKPNWDPAGFNRFLSDYANNWHYQAVEAMRIYLASADAKGCPVTMNVPGETYEFFFPFFSQRAYGKILLRQSRNGVVIFSAHPPTGPKLRCE
jgi:hypothetical protein